jgi:dynein heavy chain
LQWTTEVNGALIALESTGQQNLLRKVKSNYKKKVENYIELVEKPGLEKLQRIKIVSLIIIDQHNSELIDLLYTKKVQSPKHFDWLAQLRFRKANDDNDQLQIIVDQTNCSFEYGNEYQGNNGRLVVTPLTDRAYMTLTNALNMQRGGAPQGPAGTGKTETVKDLGKGLAYFVVIMNCSDQMDIVSLGKIFAGLALSGAWGCFDEFNRILLDVLSVVA